MIWVVVERLRFHVQPLQLAKEINRGRQIQSFRELKKFLLQNYDGLQDVGIFKSALRNCKNLIAFVWFWEFVWLKGDGGRGGGFRFGNFRRGLGEAATLIFLAEL